MMHIFGTKEFRRKEVLHKGTRMRPEGKCEGASWERNVSCLGRVLNIFSANLLRLVSKSAVKEMPLILKHRF